MAKAGHIHQGNLVISTAADAEEYKTLTKVTGGLSIYSSAKLDALTSVGGGLSIHSSAKLDAPALTSVGGDLSIYSKGALTAGRLYCGGYDKFRVIDGIGCVVLSEKKQDNVTVLMCRRSEIKNQKVIGEKFYVAQKGSDNAHGKTIAEAIQELQFKIGPRDVERYRNMPRDTKKSPSEWALVYRMVTGACQYGVARFIEAQGKLKQSYTLTEILALTRGQYGHDRFAEIVKANRSLTTRAALAAAKEPR